MASEWHRPRYTDKDINFNQLLQDQNMSIAKFLQIENIIGHCKDQADMATQALIKRESILKGLIDICLRPKQYVNQQLGVVTNQHTYKAFEILNNLNNRQFGQYLFGNKKTVAKIQMEEDMVITQQHFQQSIKFSLQNCPFTYLFTMLSDPKPIQQTALSYLFKIVTSLCNEVHRQEFNIKAQILNFFNENKQITQLLFSHFYSDSILELFSRLLQLEDSISFYKQQKIKLFTQLTTYLQKQIKNSEKDKQDWILILRNYQEIIHMMRQQLQEKFYQARFGLLNKQIFTQKFAIQFVVDYMNKIIHEFPSNQQLYSELIELFRIIEKYLHMSNNYKPNTINSINNSITPNKPTVSSQNLSDAKSNSNNQSKSQSVVQIKLNSEVGQKIRKGVQVLAMKLTQWKHNYDKKYLCFTIDFLKLVKTVLLTLQPSDSQYIQLLSKPEFIQYLLKLLSKFNSCTILHNLTKDIILLFILINSQCILKILLNPEQSNFLSMVNQMKSIQNSKQNQYQNQIYHIFRIASEKNQNFNIITDIKQNVKNFQQLENKVQQKQKFYTTLIGGDARKSQGRLGRIQDEEEDNIYNFNSETNENGFNFTNDKKSNSEDNLMSPNNNNNDAILGNTQHWFEYGLPLDSDQSRDEFDSMKKSSQNVQSVLDLESGQRNQEENQLAKRLKNIGVVQCEQKTIRIPAKKDRYDEKIKNQNKSKLKIDEIPNGKQHTSHNSQNKQLNDKGQLELQRQIKILQSKRLNFQSKIDLDDSPEILQRTNKQVDSLSEQSKQIDVQKQGILPKVSSSVQIILDISSDKDNKSHNNSIDRGSKKNISQQNHLTNSKGFHKQKSKNELISSQTDKNQLENKQDYINPFSTYLKYQIGSILSELD